MSFFVKFGLESEFKNEDDSYFGQLDLRLKQRAAKEIINSVADVKQCFAEAYESLRHSLPARPRCHAGQAGS